VRVTPGDPDGWLAAVGAAAEVPGAGGRPVRLEPRDAAAFSPAQVAQRLGGVKGADLDAALHHPAFQRVESAWRGVRLLLEHAGDAVEVELISLPRPGLAARFREAVFEPELRRADPLSLVLADLDFSHKPADLALLAELASMAKVLQAPLVAGASAAFFELRYLVQAVSFQDLLARLDTTAHAGWHSFQASEPARWVTLTVNRYLQRAAYAASDGGHVEAVSESSPDSFLWGRGVWLVGAAVARSVRTHGHALAIAGAQGGSFAGLAARPWPVAANQTASLTVEAPLAELQLLDLQRAGFTAIVGPLRTDLALLPMAVTVFRLRAGRISVEATLAYQLLAARLAQSCGRLLDEMPPGGAVEVAGYFRRELAGLLGPLAGQKPEEAVEVEVREESVEGEPVPMAEVKVRPAITLEGKPIDFQFVLPLREA
jgi:type VI secretion system protein ImpC